MENGTKRYTVTVTDEDSTVIEQLTILSVSGEATEEAIDAHCENSEIDVVLFEDDLPEPDTFKDLGNDILGAILRQKENK